MFKHCGTQNTQAYDKHTRTWSGFEISFTDDPKEISVITLTSHRRRDRKYKVTPLELSQIRALNGQLLWLGMKCLPHVLAHLSLLMGQTLQATVGTIYEVIKLARKATACGQEHHSTSMLTILLLWLRTQMLEGPLGQTALHKVDSWSSLQTPSVCKAENQTCL